MKELEPKIQARPLNEFQNNSDEEGILYGIKAKMTPDCPYV